MADISKFVHYLLLNREKFQKEFPESDAELLSDLIDGIINVLDRLLGIKSFLNNNSSPLNGLPKNDLSKNEINSPRRTFSGGGRKRKRQSRTCSTPRTCMTKLRSSDSFGSPSGGLEYKTDAVGLPTVQSSVTTTPSKTPSTSSCNDEEHLKEKFLLKDCHVRLEPFNGITATQKSETCPPPGSCKPCAVQMKPINLNPAVSVPRVSSISSAVKEMFQLKECHVRLEVLKDFPVRQNLETGTSQPFKPCFVKLMPINLNPRVSLSDWSTINEAPRRTKLRLRNRNLLRRSFEMKKVDEDKEGEELHRTSQNKENQDPKSSDKMNGIPFEEDEPECQESSFFRGFDSTSTSSHPYFSFISSVQGINFSGTGSPLKTNRINDEVQGEKMLASKRAELENVLNILNGQQEKLKGLEKEIEQDKSSQDYSLIGEDEEVPDEELTPSEIELCAKRGRNIFLEVQRRVPNNIKKMFGNPSNKKVSIDEVLRIV